MSKLIAKPNSFRIAQIIVCKSCINSIFDFRKKNAFPTKLSKQNESAFITKETASQLSLSANQKPVRATNLPNSTFAQLICAAGFLVVLAKPYRLADGRSLARRCRSPLELFARSHQMVRAMSLFSLGRKGRSYLASLLLLTNRKPTFFSLQVLEVFKVLTKHTLKVNSQSARSSLSCHVASINASFNTIYIYLQKNK